MTRQTALTPDQVRQRLRQRGVTITTWANERGYDREAVYRVLNGKDKAHYGRAHEIAVALGIKVSERLEVSEYAKEPTTAATARNAQPRKVA